jgi:3-hydroxyacyl-[acyl-carrier-protein] dehydratase
LSTTQRQDRLGEGVSTLVDLSAVDLSATLATREQMFEMIHHRHEMALLDRVIWASEDFSEGVGSLSVRGDEFWVRGHFPGKPMFPGVLMVEAGAQLACYLYNKHYGAIHLAAFLRIENAVFRRSLTVGEEMLVCCKGIKVTPRRFISDVEGIVDGQICFEAKIIGMRIAED